MASSEYSNYPNGFSPGAVIREALGSDVVPGKIFYVGNHATLIKGERDASDGNDGSFYRPLSTINAAYDKCAAGRNDVIFVRPGHTETVDAATDIVMDVSAVHILGLGRAESRPIITFATAAAAAIPVSGANNSLVNMVFKCNIASQNHMIDVAADDLLIKNCRFAEGSATGLAFITADTADGDSDRLRIEGCEFHAPTAGNYNAAIQIAKDHTGIRIIDCDIYGDFDDAGISIPAGGNAQVDLRIIKCRVDNLQTGDHAIEINGTGNTGMIIESYLQGDTFAAIVDTGGLSMFEVYVHDKADQSYAVVTGTAVS